MTEGAAAEDRACAGATCKLAGDTEYTFVGTLAICMATISLDVQFASPLYISVASAICYRSPWRSRRRQTNLNGRYRMKKPHCFV